MPYLPRVFRALRSTILRPAFLASLMVAAGLALVIFSATAYISTAQAESPGLHLVSFYLQDTAGGKSIFDQNCSGCHTIGGGVLIGPDLKDITQQRDPQWIKNFVTNPAQMVASDPAAQQLRQGFNLTMPTLGLTADQIDQVVAYLSNPGAAPAGPTLPVFPVGVGSSLNGKQEYLGETPLTYGGPACIACHTVGGAALLGGGSLGPDLTHVVQRLGEQGVAAALQNISFPTMVGPFTNHPLTYQEQADLVAFLKAADSNQAPVAQVLPGSVTVNTLLVFAIGLAGALLLFGLLYAIWLRLNRLRRPRLPVRNL